MTVQEGAVQTAEDPLFTVEVPIPEGGLTSPTIPIEWSTSPMLPETLSRKGGFRPYLLVVVSHDRRETSRHLFPIGWGSARLTAHKSGINSLHCTVVWRGGSENPGKVLLKKHSGRVYDLALLDVDEDVEGLAELNEQIDQLEGRMARVKYMGRAWKQHNAKYQPLLRQRDELITNAPRKIAPFGGGAQRIDQEVTLEVDVPKEAFGDREGQTIVTRGLARIYPWWWHEPAVDPCDVRKRALITFFSLPIAIGVALLALGLVALVMALSSLVSLIFSAYMVFFGMRGINFSPIIKPWKGPVLVAKNTTWPIWLARKEVIIDGESMTVKFLPRATWAIALYPPGLVIAAYGIHNLVVDHDLFSWVPIGAWVAYEVCALVVVPAYRRAKAKPAGEPENYDERERLAAEERARQLAANLAAVTAGQKPARARLNWHNLLADIKTTVCKRFEDV